MFGVGCLPEQLWDLRIWTALMAGSFLVLQQFSKCNLDQQHQSLLLAGVQFETPIWPWMVWVSGLSAGLRIKWSPVQFSVRTHAWVAGQVPSTGHRSATIHGCVSSSLSPSLPLYLKINTYNLKTKRKKETSIWGLVQNLINPNLRGWGPAIGVLISCPGNSHIV